MHCLFTLVVLWLATALPFVTSQDSVSYDLDSYGQGDASGTPFQTYMSNSNVKPPQMQINGNGTGLAGGYMFLGMNGEPTSGQNWPTIYGTYSSSTTISLKAPFITFSTSYLD